MIKSILAATDFSKRSDVAVVRGAFIAQAQGARLTIAHVIDDDQSERLAAAAEVEAGALLESLVADLKRDHGAGISFVVRRGDPHAEILRIAEDAAAALIVVGSHRRNFLRDTFIGTTAERSIRASRLPFLVARAPVPQPYKRPLIALDLNERDLHPLTAAAALDIYNEESATVVFAYDLGVNYHVMKRAGATEVELQKFLFETEDSIRPKALSILGDARIPRERAIFKPAPFNTHDPILEEAQDRGADLIIVGTRRKQAFERFRLGSVSEAILRRADIDVLVIPPAS